MNNSGEAILVVRLCIAFSIFSSNAAVFAQDISGMDGSGIGGLNPRFQRIDRATGSSAGGGAADYEPFGFGAGGSGPGFAVGPIGYGNTYAGAAYFPRRGSRLFGPAPFGPMGMPMTRPASSLGMKPGFQAGPEEPGSLGRVPDVGTFSQGTLPVLGAPPDTSDINSGSLYPGLNRFGSSVPVGR